MDRLWSSIRKAETLDELLSLMAILSQRTETLLMQRRMSDDEVAKIVRPLATLRQLLTVIASRESGPLGSAGQAFIAEDLAERYLELEGRIKELRNDRERERRRSAA